jgi:hypothetical protein
MGGQVVVSFDFHLSGERAADVAARDEPAWQRWMGERSAGSGAASVDAVETRAALEDKGLVPWHTSLQRP